MTAFDYTRSRATAERLIARFGQTGAIRRVTNFGTAWDPTQVTTDYACTLAVLQFASKDINGTLILQTDKMIYVSTQGLAIVPAVTDILLVDGAPFSIINVTPLSPAGTVVFYQLQARA